MSGDMHQSAVLRGVWWVPRKLLCLQGTNDNLLERTFQNVILIELQIP